MISAADIQAANDHTQQVYNEINRAAKELIQRIAAFKDQRKDEWQRIYDSLDEKFADRWPLRPLWATNTFESVIIQGNTVRITTTDRWPGNNCYDHTFWVPFEWLNHTPEQTQAELEKQLAIELAAVDERNRAEANAEQAKQCRETWNRYHLYLELRGEFEGKPAPEEPK